MNVPKLRFSEFNDDWKNTKIKDIADVVGGGTPSTENSNYWNGDIQWFTPSEIGKEKYVSKSIRTITNDGLNNSSAKLLPIGTILLSSRATVGEASILLNEASTNQGFQSLLVKKGYSNEFIYYLTNIIKKDMLIKAFGSTFLEISKTNLEQITAYVPNYNEQKKVAKFLSLLDKKIELQLQKVEALKLYKKGLILSLKKNSFDWHTVCIKDLFKITRGVVIPKNELSEFKSGEYKYPVYSSQTSNQGVLGYSDTFDFNGKYLTWTTDGANAGKVFYRNGKFRCTNVCGVLYEDNIRFTNELFAELLNYETPKHVSYVGNPKLMNNIMANIKIKIPSNDIQENISLVINTINHKVNLENNKLLKLQELKKGLMQSMFV